MSIRILYILSSGHSGSTLTDLILGSHSDIESAGEIEKYWKLSSDVFLSGDSTRKMCTCAKAVTECEYWKRVSEEILKQNGIQKDGLPLGNTFEFTNRSLIESILKVSGKSIFCDSSKSVDRLEKLLKSEIFDVEVIHLVRDPRATAYSIKKKGVRKNNRREYNFFGEIKDWKMKNSLFLRNFSESENYHLLRYEDLVDYPDNTVSNLMSQLNIPYEPQQLKYWQQTHHNICGNRMRLSANKIIKRDNDYENELSFAEWYLSTVYARELIKSFNYPCLRN